MLILGIESATTRVGCALGGHEGVIASACSARPRRHAESLAPQIRFVTDSAGVSVRDVSAVAVDVGPGLYTGLRVGIATALAIAHTLRVPVVPIRSLDLVAFSMAHCDRTIVAVLDARRGEVFHATYRPVPGGVQLIAGPGVCAPESLRADLIADPGPVVLVGDGATVYSSSFAGVSGVEIADEGKAHPSPESLVLLAHAQALREEFVPADRVRPVYLRKPDAEARWESPPAPEAQPSWEAQSAWDSPSPWEAGS